MRKNKKYSQELKTAEVKEYLAGEGSLRAACKKYEITDKILLRQWIKVYNGHREFKEHNRGKGEIYMTKGRKTTQEERVEIVAFCIEDNLDYGLTVKTYKTLKWTLIITCKKNLKENLMNCSENLFSMKRITMTRRSLHDNYTNTYN